MTLLQRIGNWNQKRSNLDYDKVKEASFILEELMELLGAHKKFNTKEEFRVNCQEFCKTENKSVTLEEEADAFADLIVFAGGALTKLYANNPELGTPDEILNKVMDANDAKSSIKTKEGKIAKNKNFVEPKLGNNEA